LASLLLVIEGSTREEQATEQAGWWAHHTSVATRLAIAVLVVSITSVVVSVVVASSGAGSEGEDLLHTRLSTIGGGKAAELEAYVAAVEAEVDALGSSQTLIEGVQEFSRAHGELATLTEDDVSAEGQALAGFYLDDFVPALEEVRGEAVDVLELASGLDSAATYLQAAYIAENPFEIGEKRLVTDGEDGSTWTEVHKVFHPILRADADRFGFADIYLIEPDDLTVVYSTEKDIDFATSLDRGNSGGTALAQLAREIVAAGRPNVVYASDFTPYSPALDEPTAFLATALYDEEELVGIFAVRLPTETVDEIMTQDWRAGRRGETGESYLVGSDGRMRSNSRAFLENPTAYVARVDELGLATAEEQTQMTVLGTTVLFQKVDSKAIRAALDGQEGFIADTSYLGEEVYTAYTQLDSGPFDWVMLIEQEQAEVDEPVLDYIRGTLIITAVFVVALTFLAVSWANSFVNPLRAITAALQRIRDGGLDTEVPASGAREFRALAAHLNAMVDNLASRRQAVSEALVEKVDVLRTLLPPAVADAVDEGDRTLVETVPHATVAVIVVDGLNEVFGTREVEANRSLIHTLVDDADEIAAINGLERIKVTGDTYYAVCGLSQPYIDQVARTVRFTLRARDAIRDLARDNGLDLDVSAGIASGPITVGLTGDARLTYDLWGDTVHLAYLLARGAGRGQVLVTGEARDRLPSGPDLQPVDVPGLSAWVVPTADATAETDA